MTVTEEFKAILAKERVDKLIPFLKSLDKDSKKEFVAELKKLTKEYLTFKEFPSMTGASYRQLASKEQAEILQAAALSCLGRKDYERSDASLSLLSSKLLGDLLAWHCPDWFSSLINDLTRREWMPWHFTYSDAVELAARGYIAPSDELIARLIPAMIFERGPDHKEFFAPQNLVRWPVTLEEHIWLIFQFETNINFSDRYMQFHNSQKDVRHWMEALKEYASRGLLDRQRVLRESVLATCRNFNKTLSGWFVDLFDFFQPTKEEFIALQPELISALGSPHSKAVNMALDAFKEIAADPAFDAKAFLDNAPLLLSSETKSVVASTLMLFEKMVRRDGSLREAVGIATCQALIHQDESLQTRACKLLVKFGNDFPAVAEEIRRYADSMLMTSRKMLKAFLEAEEAPAPETAIDSPSIKKVVFQPVQEINTVDELIFLASQAFDNNDPLHFDLLLAAMVRLNGKLDGSVLGKLEAALQRAYTMVMNDWPSTMGYLDHLLASFFVDVTRIYMARFPKETASLRGIHESFVRKDNENKAKWKWYTSRLPQLSGWSVQSRDNTYIIHKTLALIAVEKIKSNDETPLLSTPTHQGGYVDPLVLVNRLARYHEVDALPEGMDFQVAISRVASFHRDAAVALARTKLKGETLRVMEFLLDAEARPVPPFTTPVLWFVAGATRSPHKVYPEFSKFLYSSLPRVIFTGDVEWKSYTRHYMTARYNYEKKRQEQIPAQENVFSVALPEAPMIWRVPEEKKEGILSSLKKLVVSVRNGRTEAHALHEYLSLKAQWLSAEHNDIQRFISLFPSNPNPLLALVAGKTLAHGTFSSETDKRMVTKTLEALMNLDFFFSEMTALFIGTCMVTSDKTVRSFAAEIWIKTIHEAGASEIIGSVVGKHLSSGYAPVKRFTDLVSSNMLKISAVHNRALERLLIAVIDNISGEPPSGMKRLLEIFSEVLSFNGSFLPEKLRAKLQPWGASATMKKTIETLAR